jgi:hypothetical protein
MGHKRNEGSHYAKKPFVSWMRENARGSDGQNLCVSAEAAEKALQIVESEISDAIKKALLVKSGLGDKALCASHFTLADDARRKKRKEAPAVPVVAKRRRGRPSKAANK